MPSGRSFYACRTRSISRKLPGIRPFAFYGKTNRSSWGHIQNNCEKCDGGKFWLLASSCSRLWSCWWKPYWLWGWHPRGLAQCSHRNCADTSCLGSRAEQILRTVSHHRSPGQGKVALVAQSFAQIVLTPHLRHILSPLAQLLCFPSPSLSQVPKIWRCSSDF